MAHSKGVIKHNLSCFHDGECPICNIEIDVMKKLDCHGNINWVDISKDKAALNKAGISYSQAMTKLYVLDEQNNIMHSGVKGFLEVWKQLAYYRRLVPIVEGVPFAIPVLNFFYAIFARYRLVLTGKKLDKKRL
jgi:predicted DCC family thiol-disulfide oxidoreductase YuxK